MCHVIRFGSSDGTESKDCCSMFFPQFLYVDKDIGVSSYAYPSFLDQTGYKHIDHCKYDINTSTSGTDFIFRTLCGTDEFLSGSKVYKYYFKSIIHHIGTSSLEGHYVVDVLSKKKSGPIWLRYDDLKVTEVKESVVFGSKSQSTVYMLMYQCTNNDKESGRGINLQEQALRDGYRKHVVRDDTSLSTDEGDNDTDNSASDKDACSLATGSTSLDDAEPRVLRRTTSTVSVTSSSGVSYYSDDPDSNRLHSNVIYQALRIIMENWVSGWYLLGGWPTSKDRCLSSVGTYLICNNAPNHFSLVALNVITDDEKYYIHLCGLGWGLSDEHIQLLDGFKDITPNHHIEQVINNSCGYHVIMFVMLLITQGTDLRTLSYAVMNEHKFISQYEPYSPNSDYKGNIFF